jgi:hypothetical protein
MPANRKTMRKIKEVIRLKFEADLSHERIAAAAGVSKGAVTKYLQRAREVELGWPLPVGMDDGKLEALLFPRAPPLVTRHVEPDFAHLHQELKRKGVTLQLLWEEYAVAHRALACTPSITICWTRIAFQRGAPSRARAASNSVAQCGHRLVVRDVSWRLRHVLQRKLFTSALAIVTPPHAVQPKYT